MIKKNYLLKLKIQTNNDGTHRRVVVKNNPQNAAKIPVTCTGTTVWPAALNVKLAL